MSVSPLRFFVGDGFVDSVVFKAVEIARWLMLGEGAFPPSQFVVGMTSRRRLGGLPTFPPLDGEFS